MRAIEIRYSLWDYAPQALRTGTEIQDHSPERNGFELAVPF